MMKRPLMAQLKYAVIAEAVATVMEVVVAINDATSNSSLNRDTQHKLAAPRHVLRAL